MPDLLSPPKDKLIDRCAVCGFALYAHEIAGEIINGIYIDYADHFTGQAGMVFCGECWREIKAHNEEEMEISVDRRRRSEEGGKKK